MEWDQGWAYGLYGYVVLVCGLASELFSAGARVFAGAGVCHPEVPAATSNCHMSKLVGGVQRARPVQPQRVPSYERGSFDLGLGLGRD